MILVKNIEVYFPKNIGEKNILIINEKVTLIDDEVQEFNSHIKVIDSTSERFMPGFIDNHVRITGSGGEGNFKIRVSEVALSKLIEDGIITAVGLLGTDSIIKNVENLVAKAKALKEKGISIYDHIGSYMAIHLLY